jgi:hypothetical protein
LKLKGIGTNVIKVGQTLLAFYNPDSRRQIGAGDHVLNPENKGSVKK